MIQVRVHGARWSCDPRSGGAAAGTAFLNGSKKAGLGLLASMPSPKGGLDAWCSALARTNGFYAIIARSSQTVVAAVDHVRSIPLFYGRNGDSLFISDEAEWVRAKVGTVRVDAASRTEFLLAGFVSGRKTLFSNVYQVQPGEVLLAELMQGTVVVKRRRFYRFAIHRGSRECPDERTGECFDRILAGAMDRLTEYSSGRQLVIPLSGGHDSRLIATNLRKRGYDNILTYTYGVGTSMDARRAERVASALGMRWLFLEYTVEGWERVWEQSDRKAYQIRGSGWSSLPHVQDWLAMKLIAERHHDLIEPGAVVVPGHGAMAILSHLSGLPAAGGRPALAEAILERKYRLGPMSRDARASMRERLKSFTNDREGGLERDLRACFAEFEWQERQSKYLVNSVRLFESFGYDWWMPLWDLEFTGFWRHAPRAVVTDKSWYKDVVDRIYCSIVGAGHLESGPSGQELVDRTLRLVARSRLGRTLRKFLPRSVPVLSPMGFEGLYSRREWRRLRRKGLSRNGMAAQAFLDLMLSDDLLEAGVLRAPVMRA